MNNNVNAVKKQIESINPLILNITNSVTPDFIANGLLSLGASPVMSEDIAELEELVHYAAAVVINIGTLNPEFMKRAKEACYLANALNKPIVLDPVGCGATHLRTQFAKELLTTAKVAIIRGNASEICALSGQENSTKGVDSTQNSQMVKEEAQNVAKMYSCVVAMSGAVDIIATSTHDEEIARGSDVMPKVVGTGCLLTAVVAAFHAVHHNAFEAAYYASYFYALCGERAALQSKLPGAFKVAFIDTLHVEL